MHNGTDRRNRTAYICGAAAAAAAALCGAVLLTAVPGNGFGRGSETSLGDAVSVSTAEDASYCGLSTDGAMRKTYGVPGRYAVSVSAEDAWAAAAAEEYGSEKAALKKWGSSDALTEGLFAEYFLSYTGALTKQRGVPQYEGTVKLSNGTWFRYGGFGKQTDGTEFTAYLAWENGNFVSAEISYVPGSTDPDSAAAGISAADGGLFSVPADEASGTAYPGNSGTGASE